MNTKTIRQRYFGDRAFYKMILLIAIPIMLQNGITNFVNMLDNIMVGRIGTEQMSSVAIVNQLIFVFNICIFGCLSGAGIFTAQFFGKEDMEGVRYTFRFKLMIGTLLTTLAILLFFFKGEFLIQMYLRGKSDGGDPMAALFYGKQYLRAMLWGLPAFMMGQMYSSTLRECGETVIPMKAGFAAVFLNLGLNYVLIYGKFGFPELGVVGAAIATVFSRYLEVAIVCIWTHRHAEKNPYVRGLYRSVYIPVSLAKKIIIKGFPLLMNETLWASGMAFLMQCYSVRGLNVVAGMNVSNTISNLFSVVFFALGDSIAIVVGQLLGAGKLVEAKNTARKMIAFSVMTCCCIAVILFSIASLFPKAYNINEESRRLATHFIMISACFLPQNAFLHSSYFTIRSGGKTFITFLFDSVFICCVSVPIAYCLSRMTNLDVRLIFALVQAADFLKCIIGYILVEKGIWLQNLVSENNANGTNG